MFCNYYMMLNNFLTINTGRNFTTYTFATIKKLRPYMRWFGVKLLQYSSSLKYVKGRPFNTPSTSTMTVFNSSNDKRALEITFLIHDLTNPKRRS